MLLFTVTAAPSNSETLNWIHLNIKGYSACLVPPINIEDVEIPSACWQIKVKMIVLIGRYSLCVFCVRSCRCRAVKETWQQTGRKMLLHLFFASRA